jgi:hypothetical protein
MIVTIVDNGTVEWQPAALYQTSCGIGTVFPMTHNIYDSYKLELKFGTPEKARVF